MHNNWQLNAIDQQLLDLALIEDLNLPFQDSTTALLFAHKTITQHARIISKAKEPITICGLPVVQAILAKVNAQCILQSDYHDGQQLLPGATLLTLQGSATELLMLERTVLNFLQRLCAVATLTAQFVAKVKHTHLSILDTRKTTPGLRHLEKYAVQCGGGVNHRMGLYDAIMIKDTHVDLVGGMEKALACLSAETRQKLPVIIEVRDLAELDSVLLHGRNKVTRVLLDNMSPELMRTAVNKCKNIFSTEASGNINLNTISAIAATGVDFASVGMLTHSAGCVDLSMKCDA